MTASFVPADIPSCIGGTVIKWYIGSAAAQKTPPPASNVDIIIASHFAVLISGFSNPPSLTLPYFENAIHIATINVPINKTCQKAPKYLIEAAKLLLMTPSI